MTSKLPVPWWLWPLLLPLACCYVPIAAARQIYINRDTPKNARKRAMKGYQEHREPKLRPLPTKRARRPSLVSSANSQSTSTLITNLPLELRLIIWQYCIGRQDDSQVTHIELAGGNLRHCRCIETPDRQDSIGFTHRCWGVRWVQANKDCFTRGWIRADPNPQRLLALLLTCKLVYSECIERLYQWQIFDFRRAITLIQLPKVILPSRLQCLRRVRLSQVQDWAPGQILRKRRLLNNVQASDLFAQPEDERRWPAACAVLARLEHLVSLHITLVLRQHILSYRASVESQDASLIELLTPLKAVRARVFEVVLTEHVRDGARAALGAVPFHLAFVQASQENVMIPTDDEYQLAHLRSIPLRHRTLSVHQ